MKAPALEAQIEGEWSALIECPHLRRFYLDSSGRLHHGDGRGHEVGWYSSSVQLADFRADVFHEFERIRRAGHGG